jgi:uncharacterized protein YnzC (UPF0291/DUF896 family)
MMIIIRINELVKKKSKRVLTDVATTADGIATQKMLERRKYASLRVEIQRMWNMKC